jgi:tetratricopeptide (TPR) repeat protein/outer membrane protein OmpA-like peptidoglycan-associated protein
MMTPMVFQAKNHDVKNMAKHINKVYISASPDILENKGNTVTVTIEAEFPPRYFHKKAVMNITPILIYEEGETELPSMNFIGENVSGDGVVVSKRYGGTYSYTVTIPYEDEMYNSLLIVEPLVYKFKEVVHPNHQSIRDKGEFVAANSFLVAEGVINTAQKVDKSLLHTAYAEPSMSQKTITDDGDIFFMVNSDNINWSVPLNKSTQNKSAVKDLTAHILKGWKIQNIEIVGWASPEGSIKYNTKLSQNRAKATEDFLKKRLASLSSQKETNVSYKNVKDVKFVTNGNGPDWDGLMTAIEKSSIKDKDAIIKTLKSQTPEQRVAQLSKYIKQYPELEKSILPSLRRSIVKVNTIKPMMSDEQITKMCTSDPKSLSCDQMMYAATLVKELNNKEKIYITAIETYPNNAEPYCNAGVIAIKKGNIKHAKQLTNQAIEIDDLLAEAYNNLGIIAIFENNYKTAADMFEIAKELGLNTDYNDGVVHIHKGNYDKAVKLMTKGNPNCDYNVALAQTLDKKYTVAEETIKCLEENGQTLYLQAIIASRTNDMEKSLKHLSKAIRKDSKIKKMAKEDMEFAYLHDNPDFIALTE